MKVRAEVAIVGAGIVGCAVAYYLARRGVRSVVVERGAVARSRDRPGPRRLEDRQLGVSAQLKAGPIPVAPHGQVVSHGLGSSFT